MPVYALICEKCFHTENFRKRMDALFPEICPKCNSKSYHQDYSTLGNAVFLDNIDPKSVGHQAELNKKKLGHYKNSENDAKRPKKKKNFWEEGMPDISKVKNKKKYIETGIVE